MMLAPLAKASLDGAILKFRQLGERWFWILTRMMTFHVLAGQVSVGQASSGTSKVAKPKAVYALYLKPPLNGSTPEFAEMLNPAVQNWVLPELFVLMNGPVTPGTES